ncbi:hypothetical protein BH11PLA2_BH11PLA2_50180 [soil metagenome]
MLLKAFDGDPKDDLLFKQDPRQFRTPKVQAIAAGEYRSKNEAEIRGSGYVIKSLEAAAWCFLTTNTFHEAILKAVNLGDDADTTGAVCGQIAGAFYGEEIIPSEWLAKLVMMQEIRTLADRLGEQLS